MKYRIVMLVLSLVILVGCLWLFGDGGSTNAQPTQPAPTTDDGIKIR